MIEFCDKDFILVSLCLENNDLLAEEEDAISEQLYAALVGLTQ